MGFAAVANMFLNLVHVFAAVEEQPAQRSG